MKRLCLVLFILPLLIQCQPKDESQHSDQVFVHANVLPMTSAEVLPDQTVWVRDGKIHQIAPFSQLKYPKSATVIDATDQYLMPGLAEMHAHIPVPKEGNDSLVKETLFLYLSCGVTTIRGMLGDPYHLELKQKVNQGDILGPRIYTSSPSCNGNTLPTPQGAREKVAQYQKDGYDFLKIHPGIQWEVFQALDRTADSVGIAFSGHVPIDVGIRNAITTRYASIDHIDGYLEGLVPKSKGLDPASNGFFGYYFTDQIDRDSIAVLAQATKAAGIAVVPTQSLFTRWFSPASPEEMANEPEMKYMAPGTLYNWRQGKTRSITDPKYNAAQWERFIEIRKALLQAFHQADVLLLMGSDAPQIFNVPGFSIQHEAEAMAAAGLPNFAILKSGTANPAAFFSAVGEYGTLVKDASADLILLKANPLENVSNLRQISGVMVRGNWLSRDTIDTELAAIAGRYAH